MKSLKNTDGGVSFKLFSFKEELFINLQARSLRNKLLDCFFKNFT